MKQILNENTTTNIADFGARERGMLIDLLRAWLDQGLPEGFYDDGVEPMMNTSSGNVFLTNSEYQAAMMNGDRIELHHSTPGTGIEGFLSDIMDENDPADMDEDDLDYLRQYIESYEGEVPENWQTWLGGDSGEIEDSIAPRRPMRENKRRRLTEENTRNWADFRAREIGECIALLEAWNNSGLPQCFEEDEVTIEFNPNSGYVFLTNSEYQVAMESEGSLYMFHNLPYGGAEGSLEDLMIENDPSDLEEDDVQYIKDQIENCEPDVEIPDNWKDVIEGGGDEIEDSVQPGRRLISRRGLRESKRSRGKLNEASEVKYASVYGNEGIPIWVKDDGIQFLKMETGRGYISFTGATLQPATEEMFRAWETDSFEADYYWNEMFSNGNHIDVDEEDMGQEWDDISPENQERYTTEMIDIIVRDKLDSMSGTFDYVVDDKSETYYLDMISAGQVGVMEYNSDSTPLIPVQELKVLQAAWDKFHLKKMSPAELEAGGNMQLLNSAREIYEKYVNNEDLLTSAVHTYVAKYSDTEAYDELMQKWSANNEPGDNGQGKLDFPEGYKPSVTKKQLKEAEALKGILLENWTRLQSVGHRKVAETVVPKSLQEAPPDDVSYTPQPVNGRYITLEVLPNKNLKLTITDEGREEISDNLDDFAMGHEDAASPEDISYADWNLSNLLEDITVNSEYNYVDDLGEAGFGLTSAPGIIMGNMNDNGDWEDDCLVWYFDNYAIYSIVDAMMNRNGAELTYAGDSDEAQSETSESRRITKESFLKEADEPGKIWFIKNYYVEVYEDSYEEGEGDHVNSWDGKVGKEFKTKAEMLKYINDNIIYTDYTVDDFEYDEEMGGGLQTTVTVDEDNSPASESEIKKWQAGQMKLYSAHYSIDIAAYVKAPIDFRTDESLVNPKRFSEASLQENYKRLLTPSKRKVL